MNLLVFSLTLEAQCDDSDKPGFVFPRISNGSNPDNFNLTVRNNDSMLVEWSSFPNTPAIDFDMLCYNTVEEALGNQTSPSEVYKSTGPCTLFTQSMLWREMPA